MGRLLPTPIAAVALLLLTACSGRSAEDAGLAAKIERTFALAHPDVPLDQTARFYVRQPDSTVRGVYYVPDDSGETLAGRPGTVVWTTSDSLPDVSDGGCFVINVIFDVRADRLREVACYGPG